ncbi:Uncharacterised protein [Vibrio cholerae]|nr:Uncharacterised protein [Vibrio cholerae]CSI54048.1 Uncharacterised protein [Vibrio cholerae]
MERRRHQRAVYQYLYLDGHLFSTDGDFHPDDWPCISQRSAVGSVERSCGLSCTADLALCRSCLYLDFDFPWPVQPEFW